MGDFTPKAILPQRTILKIGAEQKKMAPMDGELSKVSGEIQFDPQ